MQIDIINRNINRGVYLKAMLLTALLSGLASCGGGGTSTPNNTPQPATITSIVPVGIVASSNAQPLSIGGTNFVGGMTVSVTDNNGYDYVISPAVISSATVITTDIVIPASPTDKYVNVTIKSPTGTTLASTILGVASSPKTLVANVYPILDTKCRGCHTGSANGNLDFSSYAATIAANPTGLIGIPSFLCSPAFRVVPGDPRPTSNVLINKIQASSGQPACNGSPMPPSGPALSTTEIQTIIDWVAGGAN
jgi:hypothetical protein